MWTTLVDRARTFRVNATLPDAAKDEDRRDQRGLPETEPEPTRAVREAIGWLARAQESSRTSDGGVARHYSLLTGWGSSYPETTGYIVPTLLAYARASGDQATTARARRMLDWLVSIQLPGGGFQGGEVDAHPVVPVTFNTGQILLGLAAGVAELGEPYRGAMNRAATWLVETQDEDGCWRKHPTPFAAPGEKTYETHVAWGLLEAARLEPASPYAAAALANVRWALRHQRTNGWFEKCCLQDPAQPLTHTLGYVLRGVLEGYRYSGDPALLEAGRRTGDGLLGAVRGDGSLPGRLRADWSGATSWACLTGIVQIAFCWLQLYGWTGDERYRDAAFAGNRFVRRTLRVEGPPHLRGAVKGSFPVSGDYGRFEYLNWAAKFFIDASLLEAEVRASDAASAA